MFKKDGVIELEHSFEQGDPLKQKKKVLGKKPSQKIKINYEKLKEMLKSESRFEQTHENDKIAKTFDSVMTPKDQVTLTLNGKKVKKPLLTSTV